MLKIVWLIILINVLKLSLVVLEVKRTSNHVVEIINMYKLQWGGWSCCDPPIFYLKVNNNNNNNVLGSMYIVSFVENIQPKLGFQCFSFLVCMLGFPSYSSYLFIFPFCANNTLIRILIVWQIVCPIWLDPKFFCKFHSPQEWSATVN